MSMRVGAAQREITPSPGLALAGFLGREQPSTGVRDSLFARALFLEQEGRRLLWLQADLLGLSRGFVQEFRGWAGRALGLSPGETMLAATHTHAAPAAIPLLGCGRVDDAYVLSVRRIFEELAREAMAAPEPARLVTATGSLELATDRRRKPTALTDPRVAAAGWRTADSRFRAVAAGYSMHPVALGGTRLISADWPGRTARTLAGRLPGNPVALVDSGACGNLNPPQCGAPDSDMDAWADQVAETAATALLAADEPAGPPVFRVATQTVDLPLEVWPASEIRRRAEAWLQGRLGDSPLDRRYREAVETWRTNRLGALDRPGHDRVEAEIMAVRLGDRALVGINAEVFCQFTAWVRAWTGRDVHVIGCCNGLFGYLPHEAAYGEGGYEPDQSFLFYDAFPVRRGGLESLADQAAGLVNGLFAG